MPTFTRLHTYANDCERHENVTNFAYLRADVRRETETVCTVTSWDWRNSKCKGTRRTRLDSQLPGLDRDAALEYLQHAAKRRIE